MCEQAVVRTPLVQNRSLMPSGMPSSAPAFPCFNLLSLAAAISSARSGVLSMKALSASLAASIASTCARASSSAENDFLAKPSRASAMVSSVSLVTDLRLHALAAEKGILVVLLRARAGIGTGIAGRGLVVVRLGPVHFRGVEIVGDRRGLVVRLVVGALLHRHARDAEIARLLLHDGEHIGKGKARLLAKRGCQPTRRVVRRDVDEVAALRIRAGPRLAEHSEIEVLAKLDDGPVFQLGAALFRRRERPLGQALRERHASGGEPHS